MKEEWRDIKDYEGYQCSNLGRFRSEKKILKPILHINGYTQINLYKNGVGKTFRTHRVIAETFIPNPDNLPEVNHINEDKTDNRVENLEWCSSKYNVNYGSRTQKCHKPVKQYTMDGEFVKEWQSIIDVENQMGYHHSNINKCCRNVKQSAYGFKWCYAKPQ